jgi:16S rRNA (cytosine1407-C5)-methyltransferase
LKTDSQHEIALFTKSIVSSDFQDDYVLDMASAPASKTSQLAVITNNQGLVVANEL